MQASHVVKGQTIKNHGIVTAVQHLHKSVVFILRGGKSLTVGKGDNLDTLPARDTLGRFMARVHVVLSYCEELGDIVTTHVGIKAARLAVALHKLIFPNGNSVVA